MTESRATMRASRITLLLATYFTATVWRLKLAVFGIGLFATEASVFVGHGFTRVLTVRTTPLLLVVGKRGLCPFFNAIHVEHLKAHGAIPYGRIGLDYWTAYETFAFVFDKLFDQYFWTGFFGLLNLQSILTFGFFNFFALSLCLLLWLWLSLLFWLLFLIWLMHFPVVLLERKHLSKQLNIAKG
jgi:hypothetical protein